MVLEAPHNEHNEKIKERDEFQGNLRQRKSDEGKTMSTFFRRFFAGWALGTLLLLLIPGAIFFIPSVSVADTRTDYLINMLQNSKNYRLRVQAATTLGKLRAREAAPMLVEASRDGNELVVISSAIALKQIGDPSVMPELEKSMAKAPTQAARSQLALTLRILAEIGNATPPAVATSAAPRYLIRVDAMGNSSAMASDKLPEMMRRIVIDRLQKEPGVLLQPPEWKKEDVLQKIKKDKLKAYIISGAVIRLDKVEQNFVVKLNLNVFTNPDYSLIMMPTSEATLEISKTAQTPSGDDMQAEARAVRTVADSLISSIFDRLGQGAVP
jgi:hypothetical protein